MRGRLTEQDIQVLRMYAECSMSILGTTRRTNYCYNSVQYHLDMIKRITGKNPRNFYNLVELLKEYGGENNGTKDSDNLLL